MPDRSKLYDSPAPGEVALPEVVVTGVADPDTTPPVPAKDAGKDDEEPKRRKSESANETSRRQSILYRFRKTGRRESPEKFAARMKELQAGVQKPAEEQEE